jgi:hypothetical protein
MMIRKSMISVVTAAAIITGIVGCGSDDSTKSENNSTQTINNVASDSNRISNAKGTVTGTVMDTNGNPLKDITVYLAGKTTKTDAGGVYVFNNVPVVNTTSNSRSNSTANFLQVTIAAPKGFLGATVTVRPQAQQISSTDSLTATTEGQTNPNTNFIDGYIASAGTAVLPKLGATVTGRLESITTGEPLPNQEISLDFLGLGAGATTAANDNNNSMAQDQNGVRTTYATNTGYAVMTDANGIFTFVRLPMDMRFQYIVPNYTVNGNLNTISETSTQNIGDLGVTAVIQSDSISPKVASVTGVVNVNSSTSRAMLEDDIRKTFVINFSEAMNIESDNDYTNSVIVKAGANSATMSDVNSSVEIAEDGKSITVSLDKELTDNTLLDINLLVTDFKDKAGNYLIENNSSVAYDENHNNNQVIRLKLQIFNDLNTNAPQVKTITQMTTDENGLNDAELLQTNSVAFNDVSDSGNQDNTIQQLNAIDAGLRLQNLGSLTVGNSLDVNTSMARVSFEPSGASRYELRLFDSEGVDLNISAHNLNIQNINNIGDLNNTSLTLTDTASTTAVEMTISDVKPNYVVTIIPVDELGYAGTANSIILKDNVEPTTVLQPSYNSSNNTTGNSGVISFGDGGELSAGGTGATSGTPILGVTAALLDNQNTDGSNITGTNVNSDHILKTELYNKSGDAGVRNNGMYDAKAYTAMSKNRTIGVAFSENISLNGITPDTGTGSATINSWTENNDVTLGHNDINNTTARAVDLINFNVSDVITLANNDHGRVINFTGIKDTAGNVATDAANAKVVIYDKMPPFVTKASFDGENVKITFNENIKALENGISTITIENNATNSSTATYTNANKAKYILSGKDLKIAVSEFNNLTRSAFNIGAAYIETAYDNERRRHAKLTWNTIKDTRGNSWAEQNASVDAPAFAIIDMIGDFSLTTNNTQFNIDENTTKVDQTVVWEFKHPIRVGNNNDLFSKAGSYSKKDANTTFNEVIGDNNATAIKSGTLSLSSDAKTMTLVFKTNKDATANTDRITLNNKIIITSAIDPDNGVITTITANAK